MTKWNTEKQFCSFLGLFRQLPSAAVKFSAGPHAKSTIEPPTSYAFAPRASRTAKAPSGPNTVACEPDSVLPKP